MYSTAGALPDEPPPLGAQLLYFHEPTITGYAFVEHELADLSHEWCFSATGPRYVRFDTYLSRILFAFGRRVV